MHVSEKKQTRSDYFQTQIQGSRKKFLYCKVSVSCLLRWEEVIRRSGGGKTISGPILCLGTRNGRELDLFRAIFLGNKNQRMMVRLSERKKYAFSSRLSLLESIGKSDVTDISGRSVVGVELNPDGKRKDVWIGSFDEMPNEWEGKFRIVFSNCLDHAQDPYKTAKEWFRVLVPGGHIILSYPGESVDVSTIDPVGKIALEDIMSLFPGELIYFNRFGNVFQDVIIKK